MLIEPVKRQHYSVMDFETTTQPDKLGVRMGTMTFRPSLKLLKENKIDKALEGGVDETIIDPILKRQLFFKFNQKEKTIVVYGHTAQGGLRLVESLKSTRTSYNVNKHLAYFHNLKGFDGFFIIPILNNHGYQLVEDGQPTGLFNNNFFCERFEKIVHQEVKNIQNDTQKGRIKKNLGKLKQLVNEINDLPLQCDSLLLSDYISQELHFYLNKLGNDLDTHEYSVLKKDNAFYTIVLQNVEFRDTLLLFPGASVKGFGETLTKQFKDSDEVKKDLNYFKKLDGYNYKTSGYYPTIRHMEKHNKGLALKYGIQDTFVVWAYLTEAFKHFKNFEAEPKLTIGSTAYNHWLDLTTNRVMTENGGHKTKNERNIDMGVKGADYWNMLTLKQARRLVKDEIFPGNARLNDTGMSRGLYKGGNTGGNFDFLGQIVKNVTHVDATSMYPSVSNSDRLYPGGEELSEKPGDDCVKVLRLTAKRDMNSGNNMPIANINSKSFSGTQHLINVKRGQQGYLCEPEAEMFKKTYGDFGHEDETTGFKAKTGKVIFGEFVDLGFDAKTEAKARDDEGQKNISKYPLNALTGKLGSKVEVTNVTEAGEKYKTLLQAFYTPLVSFITAYARCNLAEGAFGNFDKVLYGDTDSLFFSEFPANFPHKIGTGLKLNEGEKEHEKLTFAWLKPKGYMFIEPDGKQTCRIAGFHFDNVTQQTMTFKKFFNGFKHTQLQKVRYEKGVILENKTKEQVAVDKILIDTTQHNVPDWDKLQGEWKNFHFKPK